MSDLPNFISPFLTCIDKATNEMYILHRNDPQYLIWVKQETPMRFILVEYYDEKIPTDELLAHPSLAEAHKYVNKLFSEGFELN
jgi:hypothetical protein